MNYPVANNVITDRKRWWSVIRTEDGNFFFHTSNSVEFFGYNPKTNEIIKKEQNYFSYLSKLGLKSTKFLSADSEVIKQGIENYGKSNDTLPPLW